MTEHDIRLFTYSDGSSIILECSGCDWFHDMQTRRPWFDAVAAVVRAHEVETTPQPRSTITCVYGKCCGAHLEWAVWSDAEAWIADHMASMPHSTRWPNTFRIDHPGSSSPGVTYADAVLSDADDHVPDLMAALRDSIDNAKSGGS